MPGTFTLNLNSTWATPVKSLMSHWKPTLTWNDSDLTKFPYTQRKNWKKPLTQLKDAETVRETGDDDETGSINVSSIILMRRSDYVKLVIDARYLNSVTDLTNFSWPLEPFQKIMTRVNRKFFSKSDFSFAYHQIPLSLETKADQFHNRWKTVHLNSWILWFVQTPKLVQSTNNVTFRSPHQEETSYHLHRRYNNSVAKQEPESFFWLFHKFLDEKFPKKMEFSNKVMSYLKFSCSESLEMIQNTCNEKQNKQCINEWDLLLFWFPTNFSQGFLARIIRKKYPQDLPTFQRFFWGCTDKKSELGCERPTGLSRKKLKVFQSTLACRLVVWPK